MVKVSEKGKDFSGNQLNEDNCLGLVMYRNDIYETGNRKHDQIELFRDHKFIRVVTMKHLRLVAY